MVRMLHGLEKDNIGIITWLCDGADTVWVTPKRECNEVEA